MANSHEWTPERLQEVRHTALTLAERAKTDDAFVQKIQADPVATLTEAGLPREAVGSFLRDTQVLGESSEDVDGYSALNICAMSIYA